MVEHPLQSRWNNIRFWLQDAANSLQSILDGDMPSSAETTNLLVEFHENLDRNELELALEFLNLAGLNRNAQPDFWLRLYLAANGMKLAGSANSFLKRYQCGTVCEDTLHAIRESALTELRSKSLGVTDQFWQIHQLHDEPRLFSCIEREPERTIGQTFVGVRNEPYYWVVQSERQPDGSWRAVWGFCSHRARVYLAICHDCLTAEEITAKLGCNPDEIAVKGHAIRPRPGSRCFDSHRWYLNSPAADCRDVEYRLKALLVAIEPFGAALAELQNEAGCRVGINTALYDSSAWAYGFHLDRSIIEGLAKSKLEIDFDMYHSGPQLEVE